MIRISQDNLGRFPWKSQPFYLLKAAKTDSTVCITGETGRGKELFPKKSDREELVELLKIVNSATDDNQKKAKITAKIGTISGTVLKIAKKFAIGL